MVSRRGLLGAAVAFAFVGCGGVQPQPSASGDSTAAKRSAPRKRSANWAKPKQLSGLPNLHQVSDGLWRGAQPSEQGMAQLQGLGVRTVVNLRSLHSDRDEIGSLELHYEHIRMQAWAPEDEDVVRFLRVVTDESRQPVFVHCQHGSDRTGVMTAVYRIAVQGWTKDAAIREMTQGGFGFHSLWANLIRYVRELDVIQIKRQAGLLATT